MGRKTKNQFVEVQIEKSEKTFKLFHVKLPFPVNIAIRPKGPKEGKFEYFFVKTIKGLYAQKEKIRQELENFGYEIGSVKQLTTRMTELCPQCNRRGIPKIERKKTTDYHVRSWRYGDNNLSPKRRNDEYWLTYDHKINPKKCRIQQYQGLASNTFKPNKFKKINYRKYLLGGTMEELKKIPN